MAKHAAKLKADREAAASSSAPPAASVSASSVPKVSGEQNMCSSTLDKVVDAAHDMVHGISTVPVASAKPACQTVSGGQCLKTVQETPIHGISADALSVEQISSDCVMFTPSLLASAAAPTFR